MSTERFEYAQNCVIDNYKKNTWSLKTDAKIIVDEMNSLDRRTRQYSESLSTLQKKFDKISESNQDLKSNLDNVYEKYQELFNAYQRLKLDNDIKFWKHQYMHQHNSTQLILHELYLAISNGYEVSDNFMEYIDDLQVRAGANYEKANNIEEVDFDAL